MGGSPFGLHQREALAMKRIVDFWRRVIAEWSRRHTASRAARKRLKDLRRRDPFIY